MESMQRAFSMRDQSIRATEQSPGHGTATYACACTCGGHGRQIQCRIDGYPNGNGPCFEIKGILLERIEGYNLEDIATSPLAPPPGDGLMQWRQIIQAAVNLAHKINQQKVIMEDYAPRDVVVDKQSQTRASSTCPSVTSGTSWSRHGRGGGGMRKRMIGIRASSIGSWQGVRITQGRSAP